MPSWSRKTRPSRHGWQTRRDDDWRLHAVIESHLKKPGDRMSIERFDALQADAEAALPTPVARYFRQGAVESLTTAEAVAAWEDIRLLPHALTDVSAVNLRTTLLDTPVDQPIGVAPSTFQRAADTDGELAMARAVAATNGLMVLSSNAGTYFSSLQKTGVAWWLQAYLTADRNACRPLLERAVAAGAQAIVLTADTPVVATKYDGNAETIWDIAQPGWLQVNFDADHGQAPGHDKARDLSADDIDWLREVTGLPVVVKGILRADDARRCVEAGASAIWVSNHGGRQLDGAQATARCLAAVVDVVAGQVEVYVDGGIRSGRHLLTALALGARCAFLGRPPLWALAVGGSEGIKSELDALCDELQQAMMLAGMKRPSKDRSLIAGGS